MLKQNLKSKFYPSIVESRHTFLTKYVDGVLIVTRYSSKRAAEPVLQDHNASHSKISCTEDIESNRLINFIDLTIRREINEIVLSVYRKPTERDRNTQLI